MDNNEDKTKEEHEVCYGYVYISLCVNKYMLYGPVLCSYHKTS